MTPIVFISSKSADYPAARQVYDFLTRAGVACFFSDESLTQIGESEYKTIIDKTLDRATHLVLVTSSSEHAESRWVRYEWNSFDGELLAGRKSGNIVVVLCDGMEPGELPYALRRRQALSFPDQIDQLPCYVGAASRNVQPQGAVLEPQPLLDTVQARRPSKPLPSAAKLLIHREFAFGGYFNSMGIYMNDVKLGSIGAGKSKTFSFVPMPDGQNVLRIYMFFMKAQITVEVHPGQLIEARAGIRTSLFWAKLTLEVASISS